MLQTVNASMPVTVQAALAYRRLARSQNDQRGEVCAMKDDFLFMGCGIGAMTLA
jgi:hypothetical protein